MSRRRSFAEIELTAREREREAERSACIEHLRTKITEVARLVRRGRLTASEGDLLNRRLDAVADDLVAGLHRDDGRPVRANRGQP